MNLRDRQKIKEQRKKMSVRVFRMKMRNVSRTYAIRIYFLLVIFLVISCQKKWSLFDDSQVFRYNEHSNISSLDPAFAKKQADIWAVNQLYNGLVQLDDSLNVQPDIAKSWQISEDGKTYLFNLRKEIKFHKHYLFGTRFYSKCKCFRF